MTSSYNMLTEAQALASLGFAIFPVHSITSQDQCTCGKPSCKAVGKHPMINSWQKEATTNSSQIESWWVTRPNANIGIATGEPSNIFVIDLDVNEYRNGVGSLDELEEEYGNLPETLEALSGSGGLHLYFKMPGSLVKTVAGVRPGIDIRGNGGYIIAPPSLHVSGNQYTWNNSSPDRELITEAPQWFLNLLTEEKSFSKEEGFAFLPKGERNTRLASIAGSLRRQGLNEDAIYTALSQINSSLCESPLTNSEVQNVVKSISRYEPSLLYNTPGIILVSAGNGKKKPNEIAAEIINSKDLLTDSNNNTYMYQDGIWNALTDTELETLCSKFDLGEHTTKTRCRDTAYYVRLYTLKDNLKWNQLKRGEVPLLNGVFDIATKELRVHRKEDYLEMVFPISYEPDATCPIFDKFLETCFSDDPDKILTIEEFMGYLLMLDAPYKKALVCYGKPDTGKTVLQNIMMALVGQDRVCQIPLHKLHDSRAIAPIKGKALNAVGELYYDAMISDDGFKRLVSTGEPVQIDAKYKHPETYIPVCKHAIFTNELPQVNDHTEATYKRLQIVSFNNPIPEADRDPELLHKLLMECPGILLRALNGLQRLISNNGRFTTPTDANSLLKEMKEASNPMYNALLEHFEEVPEGYTAMADFREVVLRKYPKLREYSDKRITNLLKATGVTISETSRRSVKAKYLLGYNLKANTIQWLKEARRHEPNSGSVIVPHFPDEEVG